MKNKLITWDLQMIFYSSHTIQRSYKEWSELNKTSEVGGLHM